jgi:hypothetical protein
MPESPHVLAGLAGGFIAKGGASASIGDPHLAIRELLIIPLAVTLVVVFAVVHAYAGPSGKTLVGYALVLPVVFLGLARLLSLAPLQRTHS